MSAEEAKRRDRRPPVLLLRSFQDDVLRLEPPMFKTKAREHWNFEELLTGQLWGRGPVIAIRRCGELVPPVRAARSYYTDDMWQAEAERMAGESQT